MRTKHFSTVLTEEFCACMSEYSEPLSRFRREQIQDTVVFFGSARIHSHDNAANRLTEVRGNGAQLSASNKPRK